MEKSNSLTKPVADLMKKRLIIRAYTNVCTNSRLGPNTNLSDRIGTLKSARRIGVIYSVSKQFQLINCSFKPMKQIKGIP